MDWMAAAALQSLNLSPPLPFLAAAAAATFPTTSFRISNTYTRHSIITAHPIHGFCQRWSSSIHSALNVEGWGEGKGSPQTFDGALPKGLIPEKLPKHVAIIMDGNSRWAHKKGLPVNVGHERGAIALKDIVRLSHQWGIHALTLFAFSSDNWSRPKVEVSFLIGLFEKVLREELVNFLKLNIRMRIIGELTRLPISLQRLINMVERRTEHNAGLKLTIAVGYTGRQDIVLACQQVATEVEKGILKVHDISESLLDDKLATSWIGEIKNPDLLIRTSGEQRLSNFLLWQLAYTELFFVDACWPEFGERHYANALLSFQQRERRFGRRSDMHQN